MSQSHSYAHAPTRRGQQANERSTRVSATTAEGIAAERVALAQRERERRTSRARIAVRRLEVNSGERAEPHR
jgi:hypothetical protein